MRQTPGNAKYTAPPTLANSHFKNGIDFLTRASHYRKQFIQTSPLSEDASRQAFQGCYEDTLYKAQSSFLLASEAAKPYGFTSFKEYLDDNKQLRKNILHDTYDMLFNLKDEHRGHGDRLANIKSLDLKAADIFTSYSRETPSNLHNDVHLMLGEKVKASLAESAKAEVSKTSLSQWSSALQSIKKFPYGKTRTQMMSNNSADNSLLRLSSEMHKLQHAYNLDVAQNAKLKELIGSVWIEYALALSIGTSTITENCDLAKKLFKSSHELLGDTEFQSILEKDLKAKRLSDFDSLAVVSFTLDEVLSEESAVMSLLGDQILLTGDFGNYKDDEPKLNTVITESTPPKHLVANDTTSGPSNDNYRPNTHNAQPISQTESKKHAVAQAPVSSRTLPVVKSAEITEKEKYYKAYESGDLKAGLKYVQLFSYGKDRNKQRDFAKANTVLEAIHDCLATGKDNSSVDSQFFATVFFESGLMVLFDKKNVTVNAKAAAEECFKQSYQAGGLKGLGRAITAVITSKRLPDDNMKDVLTTLTSALKEVDGNSYLKHLVKTSSQSAKENFSCSHHSNISSGIGERITLLQQARSN